MSAGAWIACYAISGGLLAWIALGRVLRGPGARLAEGPEPSGDRAVRRAALVLLLLATIWFVAGLANPVLRIG